MSGNIKNLETRIALAIKELQSISHELAKIKSRKNRYNKTFDLVSDTYCEAHKVNVFIAEDPEVGRAQICPLCLLEAYRNCVYPEHKNCGEKGPYGIVCRKVQGHSGQCSWLEEGETSEKSEEGAGVGPEDFGGSDYDYWSGLDF